MAGKTFACSVLGMLLLLAVVVDARGLRGQTHPGGALSLTATQRQLLVIPQGGVALKKFEAERQLDVHAQEAGDVYQEDLGEGGDYDAEEMQGVY